MAAGKELPAEPFSSRLCFVQKGKSTSPSHPFPSHGQPLPASWRFTWCVQVAGDAVDLLSYRT